MSSGGDFELIFTLSPEGLNAAQRACDLTVIGKVVQEDLDGEIWREEAD